MILKEVEDLHSQASKAVIEPKTIKINHAISKVTREQEFANVSKFLLDHMKDEKTGHEIKPEKEKR